MWILAAVGLMHEAKTPWVHRDVSASNILIDSNDKPRLADLEYAKRLNDDRAHHVRTVRLSKFISFPNDDLTTVLAREPSNTWPLR